MKNKIPIICTIVLIAELAAGLLYIIYDKSCKVFGELNVKNEKIECPNIFCWDYKNCEISTYRCKECNKKCNQKAHLGQQLTEEEQALVEGVEFGRDYNLKVSIDDARLYKIITKRMKEII